MRISLLQRGVSGLRVLLKIHHRNQSKEMSRVYGNTFYKNMYTHIHACIKQEPKQVPKQLGIANKCSVTSLKKYNQG